MSDVIAREAELDEADLAADACHPMFRKGPDSVEFGKLRKRLIRQVRQALDDFAMVRPGDRWLVCLSGGKDSYTLLALLLDLKWRGMLPVDLYVPGCPPHPLTVLDGLLRLLHRPGVDRSAS